MNYAISSSDNALESQFLASVVKLDHLANNYELYFEISYCELKSVCNEDSNRSRRRARAARRPPATAAAKDDGHFTAPDVTRRGRRG